ncbi:MAG: endonuclease domain-containing protein [Dehalococcoidia bacterium]|nr:endonuclease domain-containing protein [Dehalococcoidia bacterium]
MPGAEEDRTWRNGTPPSRRQTLRRTETDAERALWALLRSRSLDGHKFRRQHSGGPYILDFTCAEAHLAVEVDGSQHYTADGLASDAARTAYLEAAGVRVLRFSNRDVLTNAAGVLEAILQALGA